jgi:hypothetical protein
MLSKYDTKKSGFEWSSGILEKELTQTDEIGIGIIDFTIPFVEIAEAFVN